MSLCPEAEIRHAMDDGEFWAHVFAVSDHTAALEDDFEDMEPLEPFDLTGAPCDICGERGACGYDTEGLPLIHAQQPEVTE